MTHSVTTVRLTAKQGEGLKLIAAATRPPRISNVTTRDPDGGHPDRVVRLYWQTAAALTKKGLVVERTVRDASNIRYQGLVLTDLGRACAGVA